MISERGRKSLILDMRILFVAAQKDNGRFSPFVEEQKDALMHAGVEVCVYAHTAHGILQYVHWIPKLHNVIKESQPNVIHAHFGLTGLMAGLAAIGTEVPVVVTYHGCDINDKKLRPFSRIAMRLARWNIFVSKRQMINAYGTEMRACKASKGVVLPCGVTIKLFDQNKVNNAWYDEKFGSGDYVLFAGSFSSVVKNPVLARQAVDLLKIEGRNVELLELKGYTREQVVTLMYRCKALLLTSVREGSPQVIKEAMACGCPIVSVDVGDVKERVNGIGGCYVIDSRDPKKLAEALTAAIAYGRTTGREKLLEDGLDNNQVTEKLIGIYKYVAK